MNGALRGNVKMALASMKNARWRSFLTMLGIIIGVVSVVTVVSIGDGIKHQVNGQIDRLGRDLITIRPGQLRNSGSKSAVENIGAVLGPNGGGALSDRDVETVAKTDGVSQAVPLSLVQGELKVGDTTESSPLVLGTTGGLDAVLRHPIDSGSFFSNDDVSNDPNIAVIGSNVARTLFQQRSPVGRSFDFLGQQFIVQGVLKQFDTTPLSLATDFNDTVFIPYSTAKTLTKANAPLYQILAKPASDSQLDGTVAAINSNLKQSHQGQQQFTVLRQDQSLAVTNSILSLMTKLITGIAAISLLVGGIGIMNVMLVSVAERMHEIGIRKALGASNRQIMGQFLTEATVLSFVGALIGIVLSLAINFSLRVTTNLAPSISWQVLLAATAVSVAVGIVFGTAPAVKAARKDPIDALRNQ